MSINFESTNWSLVVRANASNTDVRRIALAGLCEAYWYPLYSFARCRGRDHEEASDLTQGFFVHLIEKHALDQVTPTKGRFRAFLLVSFKNFQSDARQCAGAKKRGGDLIQIPWDQDLLEARYAPAAVTGEDPEQLFARHWALTVLDRARLRLREQYLTAGRLRDFEALSPQLAPGDGEHSMAELARALETTPGAARVALHRFRRRFGSALRAEVASTLENPDETEAELRFLLAVLEARGDSARPL